MTASEATKARTAATTEQIREGADYLRALVPPGTTVYVILRSVARSGLSRVLSLAVVHRGEVVVVPPGPVARVTGQQLAATDGSIGVRVSVAGMDGAFSLISALSLALYRDADKLAYRWL